MPGTVVGRNEVRKREGWQGRGGEREKGRERKRERGIEGERENMTTQEVCVGATGAEWSKSYTKFFLKTVGN